MSKGAAPAAVAVCVCVRACVCLRVCARVCVFICARAFEPPPLPRARARRPRRPRPACTCARPRRRRCDDRSRAPDGDHVALLGVLLSSRRPEHGSTGWGARVAGVRGCRRAEHGVRALPRANRSRASDSTAHGVAGGQRAALRRWLYAPQKALARIRQSGIGPRSGRFRPRSVVSTVFRQLPSGGLTSGPSRVAQVRAAGRGWCPRGGALPPRAVRVLGDAAHGAGQPLSAMPPDV